MDELFEVHVPALGESISEATIARWVKSDGDDVAADEVIAELETDKAAVEVIAGKQGRLRIVTPQGVTVAVGAVVAKIDLAGERGAPPSAPDSAGGSSRDSQIPTSSSKPPAEPRADRHAPPPTENEEREKLSKLRQTIAHRLVEAQHMTASLTTFNEVDMTAIMTLREKYKDAFEKQHGVGLGLMSFFAKAVMYAFKAVPQMNWTLDGNTLIKRKAVHLGIAVSTERGLMVPVIRHAETLSMAQIESEIKHLAIQARDGKITVDDLSGGTFTITNGGVFGSLLSTPILNPPQSGILGMHKIEKRAVVLQDTIVVRPMMYLALTYDHRLLDGRQSVTFLVKVKEALEDPSRMLLEI
ncbi:MAG: dihydrolipoyllysine-residue succinyltransferase [Phycisphaerales bacterium]|nr:dihydrolipoyllysine-residue succinyltransferase [Phycisphaerales bacterium]